VTRGSVVATGVPLGLTETTTRTGLAGQAIGHDHAYVFGELLDLTAAEVAALTAAGAIETAG
jgi:crotonobetainyl-CoA:carnitine CoA-transferase CaiB-like acyl-CoA transferase